MEHGPGLKMYNSIFYWKNELIFHPAMLGLTRWYINVYYVFLLPPHYPPLSKTEPAVKATNQPLGIRATVGCKFHPWRSTSKGCCWDQRGGFLFGSVSTVAGLGVGGQQHPNLKQTCWIHLKMIQVEEHILSHWNHQVQTCSRHKGERSESLYFDGDKWSKQMTRTLHEFVLRLFLAPISINKICFFQRWFPTITHIKNL